GIEENAKDIIQNVYPNPSNNLIFVELENKNSKHLIELLDLSGRVVLSDEINTGKYTIEKGQLKAGTYIVKVSNEFGQATVQSVLFY
ncbi:MAG: T9SS type A sorting domain-containing protein, partial [Crocinitomicaceae bacterium]